MVIKMEKISGFFRKYSFDKNLLKEALMEPDPIVGGSFLMSKYNAAAIHNLNITGMTMVNLLTLLVVWWKNQNKTIYRLRSETADFLSRVNLSFIPESPPQSWKGNAFVLESITLKPIVGNFFSVGSYFVKTITSKEYRYFFFALDRFGSAFTFSIPADLKQVNDRLAKNEELLGEAVFNDLELKTGTFSAEFQMIALSIIRFVFASSYFIQNIDQLPYLSFEKKAGPIRSIQGKSPRGVSPMWNYTDLRLDQNKLPRTAQPGQGAELDKSKLSLEPVLVSPHIRRIGDRISIIDAYDSSRWKRQDVLGRIAKI